MNDEQFEQLMDCLNGIASRLDAIESAVLDNAPESSVYDIGDVVSRLDAIESAASDISLKQGDYSAYTLEDVVKALWDIEKAVDN